MIMPSLALNDGRDSRLHCCYSLSNPNFNALIQLLIHGPRLVLVICPQIESCGHEEMVEVFASRIRTSVEMFST